MAMINLNLFILILLATSIRCEKIEDKSEMGSVGILDNLINKTLEMIKPNLADIHIPYENFETGPQEIGMLSGHFGEVLVQDLDKFNVKIMNTTFLDINNLTITEENFTVKGLYHVNGTLAFPFGKNDIQFYGDGEFGGEFTNLSISMKVKIRYENGKKIVKDLDLIVGLEKLNVYLKNLMGGGDLEEVFNKFLNDVGLTVFNYYKEPFLNVLRTKIRKFINEILNAHDSSEMTTTSRDESFNRKALKSLSELFISSNQKHGSK